MKTQRNCYAPKLICSFIYLFTLQYCIGFAITLTVYALLNKGQTVRLLKGKKLWGNKL